MPRPSGRRHFLLYVAYIPAEDEPEPNPRNEDVVKTIRYGAECTLAGDMKAALRGDGNKPKDIVQVTGTVEQWKCRFDDPNVAFHNLLGRVPRTLWLWVNAFSFH